MRGGPYVDLILVRLLFVLVVAVTCYVLEPFGLPSKLNAGVGALIGLSIVLFEWRLRRVSLTGFLDGIIVTPQFVLRELQLVADSADSLKRNRGRRGLDVLQRLQKMTTLQIQIVENDFPSVREVDLKLIELAKVYEGKI